MTPDRTDEKTMANYRETLIAWLRLKEVPGDRIGQIVAEVESHVVDTGEDPCHAFASPRSYAAQLSAERRPEPWWYTALTALAAGLAGWLFAQGALALLLGDRYHGQPGWLWLAVGLAIGIPVGVSVNRRSTPVCDPRTGVDMVPMPRSGLAAVVGSPLALILIAWAAIEILP